MDTLLSTFKALSDRNRLRIVAVLSSYEELCACQIIELLQVSGATVSRHINQLIHAGLIDSRKNGRWVFYRLKANKNHFNEIQDWMKTQFNHSSDVQKDLKALEKITACDREDLCRKQRGEICCPVTE